MGRGSCFLLRRSRQLQKTLGLAALLSILLAAQFFAGAWPLHAPASPALNSLAHGGRIHGSAKQGTIPLSGVNVMITGADSGKKFATLTDGSGGYSITLPDDGRYSIRAVFRANTSSPQEILLGAGRRDLQLNFSFEGSAVANTLASLWPPLILAPVAASTVSLQPALSNPGGASGARFPQFTGDPTFSGDIFTVYGVPSIITPYFQMADQMRQDFEDGHELQGPPMRPYFTTENHTSADADSADATAGTDSSTRSAAKSKPHGEIFWVGGTSAVDAQSFVIAGQPVPNPAYSSNGYGVTLGARPFFPGLTKPSARDYILLSYAGGLASTIVND
jgi:trimeric autotransporter adhesin